MLAGGQSLVPMLHMRLMRPVTARRHQRDPRARRHRGEERLHGLRRTGAHLAIETSELVAERLPLLAAMVRRVGDRQVRNRGTIGGSLAQADPVGEVALACLALGATIVARSLDGHTRRSRSRSSCSGPIPPRWSRTSCSSRCDSGRPRVVVVPRAHPAAQRLRVLAIAVIARRGEDGALERLPLALAGVDDQPVLAAEAAQLLEGSGSRTTHRLGRGRRRSP